MRCDHDPEAVLRAQQSAIVRCVCCAELFRKNEKLRRENERLEHKLMLAPETFEEIVQVGTKVDERVKEASRAAFKEAEEILVTMGNNLKPHRGWHRFFEGANAVKARRIGATQAEAEK